MFLIMHIPFYRGRYSVELHLSFLRLQGQANDFKIQYSSVVRLFLLPKVCSLNLLKHYYFAPGFFTLKTFEFHWTCYDRLVFCGILSWHLIWFCYVFCSQISLTHLLLLLLIHQFARGKPCTRILWCRHIFVSYHFSFRAKILIYSICWTFVFLFIL